MTSTLPEEPHAEDAQDSQSDSPGQNQNKRINRQSWLSNILTTSKYLSEISKDKSLSFRTSDKTTTRLLIMALLSSVVFAVGPHFGMTHLALACYLIADMVLILGIVIFVINRFGIIRAMEPRFALITWHLMIGTGLLALVIGFNLVAAMVLFILKDQIPSILGH